MALRDNYRKYLPADPGRQQEEATTAVCSEADQAKTMLSAIRSAGLHIYLEAGELRVGPASKLWDYDLPLIRDHKEALLALLAEEAPTRLSGPVLSVACKDCGHFTSGPIRHGVGICASTGGERVPRGGEGYAHAYETSPRSCRKFSAKEDTTI